MGKQIQTLNNDITLSGIVTGFETFEYTDAWNTKGEFRIVINKNVVNSKYLREDEIIYTNDEDGVYAGYIDKIELSQVEDKAGEYYIVEGVQIKDRLDRVTYPASGAATDSYTNEKLETIIKRLISKNAGSTVADSKRQIPPITLATDQERGELTNFSTKRKDLSSEINSLLSSQSMGLSAALDIPNAEIIFDVKTGTDRTVNVGDAGGILLSLKTKTALEIVDSIDKRTYKNVSVTAGKGSGATRTILEVGDLEAEGYGRKECATEGGDVESDDELADKGAQKLAETEKTRGISVKFNPKGSYKIGSSFYLGDYVTVDTSPKHDAQIIKIKYVFSKNEVPTKHLILDFDIADALVKDIKAKHMDYNSKLAQDPSGGGSGTDENAIHDNVAAEISAITEKSAIVDADILLIEDSEDTPTINTKKKSTFGKIKTWIQSWIITFLNTLGFCIRETLRENRTYYLRTDGSDSNDGLTDSAGGAFLTPQHMLNVVGGLDISTYDVLMQVRDGTYTIGADLIYYAPVGSGSITLQGNTGNKDAVIFNGGSIRSVNNTSSFFIYYIQMKNATYGIYVEFASVTINHMTFHTISSACVYSTARGNVSAIVSTIKIIGAPSRFALVSRHGEINFYGSSFNTTSVTSLSDFVNSSRCSIVTLAASTFTKTAISGKKYSITSNAVLNVGSTILPGNTAGTTGTGGIKY